MGLFDEVGPVQESASLDSMPLVDLFKEGVKLLTVFERNPNAATYEEMEKALNMIVDRFDEVPAKAKGMISGVPSTITMTLPSMKQLLALGPAAANVLPNLTGALKTSLNFGISNL